MDREYYLYGLYWDGRKRYLIWSADPAPKDYGPDMLLLDSHDRFPIFDNVEDASRYASRLNLNLQDATDEVILNLDELSHWVTNPSMTLDCELHLNAWNLFDDITTSLRGCKAHIDDLQHGDTYNKLFWGCNLSPVTPEGEHYVPEWDENELNTMAEVLSKGLDMLKSRIFPSV